MQGGDREVRERAVAREEPREERGCDQRCERREWRGDERPGRDHGDPSGDERQEGDPCRSAVRQVEEGSGTECDKEHPDHGAQVQGSARGEHEEERRHTGDEHGEERGEPLDDAPGSTVAGSGVDEREPSRANDPLRGVGERPGRACKVGELADADGNTCSDPEDEPDSALHRLRTSKAVTSARRDAARFCG